MTLSELMKRDTPCQSGLDFIKAHGIENWELADCWDLIKAKAPDFLGWGVKHAPMSPQKVKAIRLVLAEGIVRPDGTVDEDKNHDPEVSRRCYGWMSNPYRRTE